MPPRTTPESSRPRVSDRTMVANLAIATLVGFEQRMASSLIMSTKPLRRGTPSLDEDARGPRPSTAWCNPAEGLDARKHPRRPASGEKYLLTSPFIGLPDKARNPLGTVAQAKSTGRRQTVNWGLPSADNRPAMWSVPTESLRFPHGLRSRIRNDYSFVYSALARMKTGMSRSASFQRVKKP